MIVYAHVARLLVFVLIWQTAINPVSISSGLPVTSAIAKPETRRAALHTGSPTVGETNPGGAAPTATRPQAIEVDLTVLGVTYANQTGIDFHPPTGKLIASLAGGPHNFELIESDGTRSLFSGLNSLTGRRKIATAPDDGGGRSHGGFRAGEAFSGTGVPGTIARVSSDGLTFQNPWVTLPGETGQLDGSLHVDRVGSFGGDLIAATTSGNVWRISSSGVAAQLASLGTRLEGLTVVPANPAKYGPWAGKVLVGSAQNSTIYAIDTQGNVAPYSLGISPIEIRIVPANQNFFGIDSGEDKIWGAPSWEFNNMVGDIVVAQHSPGIIHRLTWNGSTFQSTPIAEVAEWECIAFAPSQVQTVSASTAVTATVRHAPSIMGRIEGSVQQLTGENATLNGAGTITGSLKVPGTPNLNLNGKPTFGGTVEGPGSVQPTGYSITLNGNASLGRLINRTDPVPLPVVAAPPVPSGTRDVTLNSASGNPGDFATLRNLTVNGNAGLVSVPPGTYGSFSANGGGNGFIFGIAGSTRPAAYNLTSLSLNGNTQLQVAGPVVLTLANSMTINGTSGASTNPLLLTVRLHSGGVTLNGGSSLNGVVIAPSGTVTVNGNSTLTGSVFCDRLTVIGLLKGTADSSPPVLTISQPAEGATTTATEVTVTGTFNDQSDVTITVNGVPAILAGNTFSSVVPLNLGVNTIVVVATDSPFGNTTEVVRTITREPMPVNQAPAVNAGQDQTIRLPNDTVTLSGVVADDGLPAGSTLAITWSKVSGPGQVTFANSSASETTASFVESGTYILRLTASDTDLSTSDELTVTVNPANQPPAVNAGPDQGVDFPGSVSLNGIVSDDGLPSGSTLTVSWSKVSGPGGVTFGNSAATSTSAGFSEAGIYILRLTASDSEMTESDDVTILINGTPTVDAGVDQTVAIPNFIVVDGTVIDDGLPAGSTLAITWSKAAGPGTVTFAHPNQPATTATFGAPGLYTLRLTASDSNLTATDDIQITVTPSNQAPAVSAGADQSILVPGNLILNPGNEAPMVNGEIANWTEVVGENWTQFAGGTNGFPTSHEGGFYFYSGQGPAAELRQDVDLSLLASSIAGGNQQFEFKGFVRSFNQAPTDTARIVVEYRDSANATVLSTFDTGEITSMNAWQLVSNTRTAPAGTGWVRIRLIATRNGGASNDGYFDTVSLRALPINGQPPATTLTLNGSVVDDGLPSGASLSTTWSKVSGAGNVSFSAPNQASTLATFGSYGIYVLRLTASDSELAAGDEVQVSIEPGNQPPSVNAGADITISQPNFATLNPTVSDDGLPLGSTLTYEWSRVSGPSEPLFANPNQAATSVSFRTAGVFVLRLTVSDSSLFASDDVRVTVSSTAGTRTTLEYQGAQAIDLQGTSYLARVKLTNWTNGQPIPNKPIDFVLNDIAHTAQTDADGVAGVTFTPAAGTTQVTGMAIFNEDAALYSSSTRIAFPIANRLRATLVVFQDNFDAENSASGAFNYDSFIKWDASNGSVDLFGNGFASASTGLFVDLDGTTQNAGRIETRTALTLPPGDYTLLFNMTGNIDNSPGSPNDRMTVSLGAVFSEEFIVPSTTPRTIVSRSFTLTQQAAGALAFDHFGGDNHGIYLDNVLLVVTTDVLENQAPVVNAGLDQVTTIGGNLTRNPGTEEPMVADQLPNWTMVAGSGWRRTGPGVAGNPPAVEGGFYFGDAVDSQAELRQDVSVLPLATRIDAGTQQFAFGAYVRSTGESQPDTGRIVVEFRDATNAQVLGTFDTGQIASTSDWLFVQHAATAPVGTRWVRIRFLTTRNSGDSTDVFFDYATLRAPGAAGIRLFGSVTDDGLPQGATLTRQWSQVSGPETITLADPSSEQTAGYVTTPGVYTLKLTGSDTEYSRDDEVVFTVLQENQAPVVNAGADQSVNYPATAALNGSATDDGLPASSALTFYWTRVSGTGTVTFGDRNSLNTTASFSGGGVYVLRLTASDGEAVASDDLVITVSAPNQAPVVNAGSDQTITLPANSVNLNGSATDDGLPAAGSISLAWTKVSGTGNVTFGDGAQAATTATFTSAGVYVLRLSATDGELSSSDEVQITVVDPASPPPVVAINSPTDGAEIKEPTSVVGSVSGGASLTWRLEYALGGDDTLPLTWTTLATGTGAVTNAALGQLDPTLLLNGIYAIRLSSTNDGGQTASMTIAVLVSGQMKVGNFMLSFNDLTAPVAGLPIQIIRSYDSRDKRAGDFGVGWTLGIKNVRLEKSAPVGRYWSQVVTPGIIPRYCIEPLRPHLVTITFPDSRVYKFTATLSPQCQNVAPLTGTTVTYTPVPGSSGTAGATLTALGDNSVIVDGPSQGSVNLVTTNGLYNPRVFELKTVEGMVFVIEQGVGVKSMREPNGNTLTITSNGVTHSSGKSITFTRDFQGRITQITDPAGNPMTYSYDGAGDLVSFRDRVNNVTTFSYNGTHGLLTISDPRGIQPIRNDYDAAGRLISHTDAFGKTITYTHNLGSRQEIISDRLNIPILYEYDGSGNVLRMVDALGHATMFTYDSRDNKLTETNALGKTTSYVYDASDNLIRMTDPLGNVSQYTYNARHQVLTTTDARGGVTTNTDDSNGNFLSTKDALNNTTSYTYSPAGLPLTMTDALSGVTRYEYDGSGNLTRQTDPLGSITNHTYDTNGNRLSQSASRTLPSGSIETVTTGFEYDKLNRLVKTTLADGSTTRTVYNSVGQQAANIDQLNRQTSFDYDEMGRLTKTTYPDGAIEEATYDAEGRRLTSKDRAGRVTSFEYDPLGRMTKTIYVDGSFTSTVFDVIGRVISTTDARGHTTSYEYDANCGCSGRRTKMTDALNHSTSFSYDANGNQSSMTDANGHTMSYEYDLLNRQTKLIYADGTFDQSAYDAVGRVISKTDQAGKVTQYGYDGLGRLISVTDSLNQITRYAYDELGNQISQTDALARVTRFEYDKLGRRTKRTLPIGQVETYTYNSAGNLLTRRDFNLKTTTYAYDAMNRLLAKTPDASFAAPAVTFTYSSTGRRLTMTDGHGLTTYGYDNRDRLMTKATPEGTLTYSYDAASNVLSMQSSNENGVNVSYTYDESNRLSTVADNSPLNPSATNPRSGSGVTNYRYDDSGSLAGYLYPNGVDTSYTYNSLNRLMSMGITKAATQLASYTYTLGAAGNRTSVTELNGRKATYSYDGLYRLTSETITLDPVTANNGSITYTYDAVGNRLQRTSTVAAIPATTSTFDGNDRVGGDSYDSNGSTTASAGKTYSYDFENRIVALNPATPSVVTFVYDGDGNRVAKTAGGVTTKFLVPDLNPTGYAQVVEETVGGTVERIYIHGHSLISQTQITSSNWVSSFYGYDGHGSVRFLTNSSGAITDTYSFDAFGNRIASTGATANSYLYGGEQFDPDLGFYYLRARYMNQSTGRFWTVDSFEGLANDPKTLHKYLYASADPLDLVDPSGNISLPTLAMVAVMVVGLVGLSVVLWSLYRSDQPMLRVVSFDWSSLPEEKWSYDSTASPALFTFEERELIKFNAESTFKKVFAGFQILLTNGGGAVTNRITLREEYTYEPGKYHDVTGFTPPGNFAGGVEYSYIYLRGTVFGASAIWGKGRSRRDITLGVGTGLGHVAAHEFLHQMYIEKGKAHPHTTNGNFVSFGEVNGVKGRLPEQMFYGSQTLTPRETAFLKERIPFGN